MAYEQGTYHLLYLDSDWEYVTDTWHETLDDAMDQAEFEYQGMSAKWETVYDGD